jgi:hypothetical protein
VLVDLFCPPLTTTTTVLTIPHRLCPSSPYFAKLRKVFLEGAKRAILRKMAFFNGKKSALEKKRF